MTVWLATWTHDEGVDIEVYSTEAAALDAADRMSSEDEDGYANVIKKEVVK